MSYEIIVNKILDNMVSEFKKEENQKKINIILEPLIHNTVYQIYPYILIFILSMITLFVLVFTILLLNIKNYYK
jgi:hypothetical protein